MQRGKEPGMYSRLKSLQYGRTYTDDCTVPHLIPAVTLMNGRLVFPQQSFHISLFCVAFEETERSVWPL